MTLTAGAHRVCVCVCVNKRVYSEEKKRERRWERNDGCNEKAIADKSEKKGFLDASRSNCETVDAAFTRADHRRDA